MPSSNLLSPKFNLKSWKYDNESNFLFKSAVNLTRSGNVTSLLKAKTSVRSGDISSIKKFPSNIKFESLYKLLMKL